MQEQTFDQHRLYDESAAWVARLLSDNVSQRDRQRFSDWLNLSPSHQKTFDEIVDTWQTTAATRYLFSDAQFSDELLSGGEGDIARRQRPALSQRLGHWLKSWQAGLALASLGCLAIVLYTLFPIASVPAPTLHPAQHYSTAPGEQQRIELADGSIAELNTRSALSVTYSETARQLSLHKGEAYFHVMPDKQRPFVVDVGRGTVTAVGTAFNIYRKAQETVVSVTEGTVQVREKEDRVTPNPVSEKVEINQQIHFDKRGLSQAAPAELHKVVAWRDKTIIFDNIELSRAIEELNRYLPYTVDASDHSLSNVMVSGTFSLDAPEATLQALVTSFDLKIEQSSPQAPLYLRIE